MNSTAMHRNSTRYWKGPIFCCSISSDRSIVCAAAKASSRMCSCRPRPARLLLVRDVGRYLVEFLAAVFGDDDGAADIDAMLAETGVGLEGEDHAGLHDRAPLARCRRADEAHAKIEALHVDLGSAG